MQKYHWVLNIPPGQKSITSYISIKTLHLAPLIPLNRFALSQTEELILSHLSLWYGSINKSKSFSFVRHYPPSNNTLSHPSIGAMELSLEKHTNSKGKFSSQTWIPPAQNMETFIYPMSSLLNYCFLNSSLITSFKTLSKARIPFLLQPRPYTSEASAAGTRWQPQPNPSPTHAIRSVGQLNLLPNYTIILHSVLLASLNKISEISGKKIFMSHIATGSEYLNSLALCRCGGVTSNSPLINLGLKDWNVHFSALTARNPLPTEHSILPHSTEESRIDTVAEHLGCV